MAIKHVKGNPHLPDLKDFAKKSAKRTASKLGLGCTIPSQQDLYKKVPRLTREQFELRLVNIESTYQLAYESAFALNVLHREARDIARQRRMNMMVDTQIATLMDESNITIETRREERQGNVPFPPQIMHDLTMLNFDNNR